MSTPSQYEFFSMEELSCKCCGQMHMNSEFMNKLVRIRRRCGFKISWSSMYRCEKHDAEESKDGSGAHVTGHAGDALVNRGQAFIFIKICLEEGITGIGVLQKGDVRFVHVDDLTAKDVSPRNGKPFIRPTIWSY